MTATAPTMTRDTIRCVLSWCLTLACASVAHADLVCCSRPPIPYENDLLLIDVSDPTAVRFTATEGLSDTTAGAGNATTLAGFLSNDPGTFASGFGITGDLTAAAQGQPLDGLRVADVDLAFLRGGGFNDGDYLQGTRAFTGSSVIDLSTFTLPDAGFSGFINVNSFGDGLTIGTYRVVAIPEPNSLVPLGLAWLAARRLKRSKRRLHA